MARPRTDIEEEVDDTLEQQIASLQAQVQKLLAAQVTGGGISLDMLRELLAEQAKVSAEAHERAMNPSNKVHPGISVYSYPEGDVARPRDDLKSRMFWVGYELTTDTLTWEEIELLNQMEAGTYRFLRTDKTWDDLKVDGQFDNVGRLTRLLFTFETKERRETLPSMVDLLRSALHLKSPEQMELERLRAELESMKRGQAA